MRTLCVPSAVFFKRFIVLGLTMAVVACSPIIDNRGHSNTELDLSQVVKGQSTRDDVAALLGSPSSASDFGDPSWYYISTQKETVGVFRPEIVKQHVTEIVFDDAGTVKEINEYGKEEGKSVEIVNKTTPSAGHSLTAIEQLLSNFGKFATPGREINPTRGY